jgi:hypothetical protein
MLKFSAFGRATAWMCRQLVGNGIEMETVCVVFM